MTRLDLLLAAMVAIWGGNFSLVKVALRDFPELAFNAFRLVIASTVFLLAIWHARRSEGPSSALVAIPRADWKRLVVLGIVGHLAYQLFFLAGVKRTSVGNGSLIMGTTPVVVALLTAWTGHERVSLKQWVGAALSFTGLYIVVAEQYGAATGLGYLSSVAAQRFQMAAMFVPIIIIAGLGAGLNELLKTVERRLENWKPQK